MDSHEPASEGHSTSHSFSYKQGEKIKDVDHSTIMCTRTNTNLDIKKMQRWKQTKTEERGIDYLKETTQHNLI